MNGSLKNLPALLAACSLLALPSLHAQAPLNTSVQITKIETSFVDSPKLSGGYSKKTTGRQPSWLEVEVTFDRAALPAGPKFADELTFNYYILLKNEAVNEDRKPTMLTGSVTHVHVPEGKALHAAAFVSPKSLQRLFAGKIPVNVAQSVTDVGVTISGKDGLLAIATAKGSVKGDKGWWDNTELYTGTPGFVLNKDETPFAPLEWDYFEAIKPKSAN